MDMKGGVEFGLFEMDYYNVCLEMMDFVLKLLVVKLEFNENDDICFGEFVMDEDIFKLIVLIENVNIKKNIVWVLRVFEEW